MLSLHSKIVIVLSVALATDSADFPYYVEGCV